MIIYKNLIDFVVLPSDSLSYALRKIEKNKHKIVYVVDEKNHLLGALADGDFRRWAIERDEMNLAISIDNVYNKSFFSMDYDTTKEKIESELKANNRSIPLVDASGHLLAIVENGAKFFNLDGKRISDEDPAYIIAEIGNNHQGDIALAKKLVDHAVAANVDCVKFQMRSMDALYGKVSSNNDADQDLGAQYTLDLLSKYQLTDDELYQVFDYCKGKNVTPLCTPWDLESLEKLESYGMDGYKVASADFTNYQLLEAVALTGKLMICSTGMSSEDEVRKTVDFLERRKAHYVLLHCNSTYPTPFKDINLNYLKNLKKISGGIVGYSGHERGWSVPIAAVALGAKVIEKHFTLDKSLQGNDHKVSLLPGEFKQMVKDVRAIEVSMGSSKPRDITQGELMNREVLAKSLFINCDLAKGQKIERRMIDIRSPGKGLQPNRLNELVGEEAKRDLKAGDVLFSTDITGLIDKKQHYDFTRPYGIPVRYHDYKSLTYGIDMDFVEFHLSYGDMRLNVDEYVDYTDVMGFAVHAPELFENDHLLDLASYNMNYRNKSIKEMQRVVEEARKLKEFFPRTQKPVIVMNAGGWNETGFLDKTDVDKKYELIKQALAGMDLNGVEIAIQTMPPFPWHFGGQSYHSLFVDADEIVEFCKQTGIKICLDVSHSMMACNYYKKDIYEFVKKVGPYTVHLHIVDAKGSDGEGIQIGRGDVDFKRLGKLLNEYSPNVQFIPEVWQGHKNGGEGFWEGLAYLERKFSNN
jgi:N-acetylneuraminate synthase